MNKIEREELFLKWWDKHAVDLAGTNALFAAEYAFNAGLDLFESKRNNHIIDNIQLAKECGESKRKLTELQKLNNLQKEILLKQFCEILDSLPTSICVSHEDITDRSFCIAPEEIKIITLI